ncbi:unnamed protein product, partial [Symbiodinium necroappetens]
WDVEQTLSDPEKTQARENLEVLAQDGSNATTRTKWRLKTIGEVIYVNTSLTGVEIPPADAGFIELTAGLDGASEYNEGKLTGETITGSGATLVATAVIDDAESPMNGATIPLINTEERVTYSGERSKAGDVFNDQMQDHGHELVNYLGTTAGGPAVRLAGSVAGATSGGTPTVIGGASGRTGDRTRAKGQFLVAFLKYKDVTISKSPIEGGIEISDQQYAEAFEAKLAGREALVLDDELVVRDPAPSPQHTWENGEWVAPEAPEPEPVDPLTRPLDRVRFEYMRDKLDRDNPGFITSVEVMIEGLPETTQAEADFKLLAKVLWRTGTEFFIHHGLFQMAVFQGIISQSDLEDHCTMFPEGDWAHCCQLHDIAYDASGTPRLEADLDLLLCLTDMGRPIVGIIMFLGVVLFGWLFYRDNLFDLYHQSGNERDRVKDEEYGPQDGSTPGHNSGDDDLLDLELRDLMHRGRKVLLAKLVAAVEGGYASPAEMATLRAILKDNGIIMGDPFGDPEGATEGTNGKSRTKAPLPEFDKPEY